MVCDGKGGIVQYRLFTRVSKTRAMSGRSVTGLEYLFKRSSSFLPRASASLGGRLLLNAWLSVGAPCIFVGEVDMIGNTKNKVHTQRCYVDGHWSVLCHIDGDLKTHHCRYIEEMCQDQNRRGRFHFHWSQFWERRWWQYEYRDEGMLSNTGQERLNIEQLRLELVCDGKTAPYNVICFARMSKSQEAMPESSVVGPENLLKRSSSSASLGGCLPLHTWVFIGVSCIIVTEEWMK